MLLALRRKGQQLISTTKVITTNGATSSCEIDVMTAANFLHKYAQVGEIEPPREERIQLSPQGPFKIKLIQALNPETITDTQSNLLIAEGQGSSAKDARNMARISLVKKMLGVLKVPHQYFPKPIKKQLRKEIEPYSLENDVQGTVRSLLFPEGETDGKRLLPMSIKITAADLKNLKTSKSPTLELISTAEVLENEKMTKKKKKLQEKKLRLAKDKETVLATSVVLSAETLALKDQVTDLAMELEAAELPWMERIRSSSSSSFEQSEFPFQDKSNYVDALGDVEKFTNLPIRGFAEKILRTIEGNQVTVISAATGSGKTTQVPQYILELYRRNNVSANIIVTQPRRIAAISIAKRITSEMNEPLGKSVGYSVRFDSRLAPNSGSGSVNLMTAGILLKMLQNDPLLRRATHLILDEVHERDLFTDTLLLIIKQRLLTRRPDLKVILMSATLSSDRLIKYFESDERVRVGKVLDIAGTNYPITKYFLEDVKEICPGAEEDPETRDFYEAEEEHSNLNSISVRIGKNTKCGRIIPHNLIARLVAKIDRENGAGGILVFLPGWEEMMNVMRHLAGRIGPNSSYRVYMLHSTGSMQCDLSTGLPLSEEESVDVFTRCPPGMRKIVLSTNIAESSVTIPDIVHVIDSGKQKLIFYDAALRINCLEMAWASKANTKQRMGRAGRCQPGFYYAVMSRKRFEGLPDGVPPEIARLDLAEAALGIKASGLEGDLQSILRNACDPPEEKLVGMAARELVDLGAFREEDHSLTPLGRALARFPIHPRLSRMLMTSIMMKCSDDIISTVATIGERPYKPTRTDMDKARLRRSIKALISGDEWGDHLMLTNVLENWKRHYFEHPALSFTGLKKMHNARLQYEKSLLVQCSNNTLFEEDEDEELENDSDDPWKVTRFVLSTGFYPDIAVQRKRNIYWVNGMPQVKLLPVSSEYEGGIDPTQFTDNNNGLESVIFDRQSVQVEEEEQQKRRPKFYVFEELMDTGASIKSMRRITAIDPLFLILSAKRVKLEEETVVTLSIDDFVKIDMARETTAFMLELRALWERILSVGIPMVVQGERIPAVERAATLIRSVIKRESDIFRRTKHDILKQQANNK